MKQKQDPIALSLPADPAALEIFIDAGAALAGLKIDPAHRDGVKLNLGATVNAAKFVLSFPLEDDAEPGPVFRA
jgi:hypothetical protein